MEPRDYQPGDVILREDEPTDFVYRIIQGEVEIYSEREGQIVVLGTLRPGDFVGELGILDGQPRCASARAKSEVSTSRMERWEFFQLMSQDSASAARLIARLSDRLRAISRKLAEVTVSKNAYIYAIEDFSSQGDGSKPSEPIESDSESGRPRITILPASKEVGANLPKDGPELSKLPFSVGRRAREDEPGPDVAIDLELPDSPPFRLSRQHFSISRQANGYVVLDLGSTLGTRVNGESLGHDFGDDHKILETGENTIQAGGLDSPFTFKVLVEEG